MTSAKSPSLGFDESVAIKPIPAILCYPDWDDAKGVNATAEIMTRSQRIVGSLRQALTASAHEHSAEHVIDESPRCRQHENSPPSQAVSPVRRERETFQKPHSLREYLLTQGT